MAKSKLNSGDSSQMSHEKAEAIQKSSFFTVLGYCMLIIFTPIIGFFASKHLLFDGALQLDHISSNIYSAIVAVVSLHLALFLYIYRAYFDSEPAAKSKKRE